MKTKKMNKAKHVFNASLMMIVGMLSIDAYSHGLMESPASRNQYCGVVTKPDHVPNGTAVYPICGEAFADDFNGGYSFMSVLTHAEGRKVVRPLPENVCGFNAETFQDGPTPWDKSIDWPTTDMQAGRNEIVWNIEWGPHFSDTKEFVYWITKPDFQYQIGVPLTWDDFESTPFCDLQYDHSTPNANPDIVPDEPSTRFKTYCTIPERQGRHVIYGEWGRNQFTFERFHGCVDTQFTGVVNPDAVDAKLSATPNNSSTTGAGSIQLDAGSSTGTGLSYQWAVSSTGSASYTLSSPNSSSTQLSFTDPSAASTVTVTITVTDSNNVSDNAIYAFEHLPEATPATWKLESLLTNSARTLNEGDMVTLRVVSASGVDTFIPAQPLIIDGANKAADAWPSALAQLINTAGSDVSIGLLDPNGDVIPQQSATTNYIYSRIGADISSVFLNVTGASASNCEFIINNEWGTGYTATVKINNNGATPISGWAVNWTLQTSQVSNLWNANFTAGAPNTASNLSWNGVIQPAESVEFGFNGTKNTADTPAEIPPVFGNVCN